MFVNDKVVALCYKVKMIGVLLYRQGDALKYTFRALGTVSYAIFLRYKTDALCGGHAFL